MITLDLDPIGVGILHRLNEARDAMNITATAEDRDLVTKTWCEEHRQRMDDYESLVDEFASHLLLMSAHDHTLQITMFRDLWQKNLRKVDEDRESGKLWDAANDIASDHLDFYFAPIHRKQTIKEHEHEHD